MFRMRIELHRFSAAAWATPLVLSFGCGFADDSSSGQDLQRLEGEAADHNLVSGEELENAIGPVPQLDPTSIELSSAVNPDELEKALLLRPDGDEGVEPGVRAEWVAGLLKQFELSPDELLRAGLAIAQRSEDVGFYQLQTLTVQIVLHHSNTPAVRAELVWLYENAEAVATTALALKGERAQRAAADLQLVFQRGALAVLIPFREHERVKPLFEHAASSGNYELEIIADPSKKVPREDPEEPTDPTEANKSLKKTKAKHLNASKISPPFTFSAIIGCAGVTHWNPGLPSRRRPVEAPRSAS